MFPAVWLTKFVFTVALNPNWPLVLPNSPSRLYDPSQGAHAAVNSLAPKMVSGGQPATLKTDMVLMGGDEPGSSGLTPTANLNISNLISSTGNPTGVVVEPAAMHLSVAHRDRQLPG